MKTSVKPILSLLFLLISVKYYTQNAGQYMESMTKEFKKISEETWDYTRAVAHGKRAKAVENRRRDMLNANRGALTKIRNMKPFEGDASYRDSTVRYLEMSYQVLNNDYSKIVDMEEIAEQSYDAMEAYMMAQEKANERLEAAFDVASNAQKDFAKKHNILLKEDESKTSEKLEKASEVFKFYNKVYLIFFKPFKQEAYMIEAMNKNDINGMKQNQEALAKLAKEAKESLKTLELYQGNTTLKAACADLMDFYIYESEKQMPQLIDFYLKKEKFEKLKTAMEKKSNPGKAEIDEYNQTVNDFNKAGKDFNNINNDLNNKRAGFLNTWNNSVSKYLDRNVSKKK